MLTHDADIAQDISEDWEQLADSQYPEDILTEWADSAVPIYTSDIIKEWTELPIDYHDTWEEFGLPNDATITKLMAIDLYQYYLSRYLAIYETIKTEKEDNA